MAKVFLDGGAPPGDASIRPESTPTPNRQLDLGPMSALAPRAAEATAPCPRPLSRFARRKPPVRARPTPVVWARLAKVRPIGNYARGDASHRGSGSSRSAAVNTWLFNADTVDKALTIFLSRTPPFPPPVADHALIAVVCSGAPEAQPARPSSSTSTSPWRITAFAACSHGIPAKR